MEGLKFDHIFCYQKVIIRLGLYRGEMDNYLTIEFVHRTTNHHITDPKKRFTS